MEAELITYLNGEANPNHLFPSVCFETGVINSLIVSASLLRQVYMILICMETTLIISLYSCVKTTPNI